MISFRIPGEAPSAPNLREHWAVKAKRVKQQRAKVTRHMPKWDGAPLLYVRLTRVSPRELDDDNVRGSLKGHRDACASRLRVDDATPLVRWEYAQAKGPASVVVQIWAATEPTPPMVPDEPVERRRVGKIAQNAPVAATSTPKPKRGKAAQPEPAYMPPRTPTKQEEPPFAPHHKECECDSCVQEHTDALVRGRS